MHSGFAWFCIFYGLAWLGLLIALGIDGRLRKVSTWLVMTPLFLLLVGLIWLWRELSNWEVFPTAIVGV